MNENKGPISAGAPAPGFVLPGRFGRLVSLAEFRGKKNVLVYFYPKDDTPGCTKEACSLRDGWKELKARDVEVIGISRDSLVSHDAFASKFQLPFELLSDPNHTVHETWGAWGETKWGVGPLRRSFLVGKDGRILHVFHKVDTEHHAEEVLTAMESSVPPGSQPPSPEPQPAAPAAPGGAAEAVEKAAQAVQAAVTEVGKEARKKVEEAAKVVARKAETAGKAVGKAARKVARKVAKKAAPKKRTAKKVARRAAPKRRAAKKGAQKARRKAPRKPARKTARKPARKTARKPAKRRARK